MPVWLIQLVGVLGALSIPVGFVAAIRVIVSARDAIRDLSRSMKGAPDEPGVLYRLRILEAELTLQRESLIEAGFFERRRQKFTEPSQDRS